MDIGHCNSKQAFPQQEHETIPSRLTTRNGHSLWRNKPHLANLKS